MVKLEDYTIGELKKMISSFNKIIKFSAYSKMKKAELINMLRHHKRIIVEEGSNGVKIMIDTEEDFKKQTKVKKEKVKKEVKKEVEKLDDVKVVVKPSNEKPEEKPKKKLKFNIIKKKEEPKQLFNKEEKELNEKTLNMILKADVVILLKPADVAFDPKLRKKIQRLYNKLFKVYEKSYGDLLDKYNISKSNYSQKAERIFGGLIKEARKEKEK